MTIPAPLAPLLAMMETRNLTTYLEHMGPICDHHRDECPDDCEGQLAWRANAELAALKATLRAGRDAVIEECAKVCETHSRDLYDVSYAEEKSGCDAAAVETRQCAETAHDLAVTLRALKTQPRSDGTERA